MNLKDFNVEQEVIACKNPIRLNWNVAIDIGFSSVKGMSPNKRFCFPSFVKKIEGNLTAIDENDIYYRDEDGIFLIGDRAQNLVRTDDTNDTESFFSRNRYFTKEFLILARTAVAIALMDNAERKKLPQVRLFVQTGLPAAYLKEDARKIKGTFTRAGSYSVRMGNGPWMKFENSLKVSDVAVMSQPAGTLNSIMIDDYGQYHESKKKLLSQNILIADVGFGTFDPYGLVNREIVLQESINNLGMKTVLETASKYIYEEHGTDIRIPQMRKYMKDGYFKIVDIQNMTSKNVSLAPYIEKACAEVAKQAASKLYEMSKYFSDYDILVVTGGTGAAWFPYIKDAFSGIESLEILLGNDGCGVPVHYANVRGYYMSALLRERFNR